GRYATGQDKPMFRQYGQRKNNAHFNAAVKSKFSVEYVDVDIPQQDMEPQVIEIAGSNIPIILHFKTISSPIQLQQMHVPSKPSEIQETKSEDEPQILRHFVTKPSMRSN